MSNAYDIPQGSRIKTFVDDEWQFGTVEEYDFMLAQYICTMEHDGAKHRIDADMIEEVPYE